jgi:hypothetical protein
MKNNILIIGILFSVLIGCNSTQSEHVEPKTTTVEPTVIVLPNYYGSVPFERTYMNAASYTYTPTGTILDNTFTGNFHFRYNQGANNDVVVNMNGTEFYLQNMGKIPDQYFPGDRCSVAKFLDAGQDSELGVCQSGKTVFWNKAGYIVFY